LLLIDGHNVIGRASGLSLSDEEGGRQELISRLAASKGHKGGEVVIVFDGNRPGAGSWGKVGAVNVRYSPSGRSADDTIISIIDASQNPRAISLVTSDNELAARARSRGVSVTSSAPFWKNLTDTSKNNLPKEEKPAPSQDDAEHWLEVFKEK